MSGRTDRRLITAVHGGPDPLVSGEVDGSRYVVDLDAKALEFEQNDGAQLPAAALSSW